MRQKLTYLALGFVLGMGALYLLKSDHRNPGRFVFRNENITGSIFKENDGAALQWRMDTETGQIDLMLCSTQTNGWKFIPVAPAVR